MTNYWRRFWRRSSNRAINWAQKCSNCFLVMASTELLDPCMLWWLLLDQESWSDAVSIGGAKCFSVKLMVREPARLVTWTGSSKPYFECLLTSVSISVKRREGAMVYHCSFILLLLGSYKRSTPSLWGPPKFVLDCLDESIICRWKLEIFKNKNRLEEWENSFTFAYTPEGVSVQLLLFSW